MEEEYLLVHEYTKIKIRILVGKKEKFFFVLTGRNFGCNFLGFCAFELNDNNNSAS